MAILPTKRPNVIPLPRPSLEELRARRRDLCRQMLAKPRPAVLARRMTARGPYVKPKKCPPPWRKPVGVELAEEIRDLERDIAKHSSPQTLGADGKQPGTQEPQTPQTGNPASSSTRKRQRSTSMTKPTLRKMKKPAPRKKPQAVDLSREIRDLERDIARRTPSQTSGAPSWAKGR